MTADEWIIWIGEACEQANLDIPRLTDRLSEEAAVQPQEDSTTQVLRWAKGQLSPDQQEIASRLIDPIYAVFFQTAEQGRLFGSLDRAYEKFGERIRTVLNSGSKEYQKLAKTFVTFDTELDDLAESNRALLLYHVLKEAEISIRGLFFPSPGPHRIPVSKREEAMKELLARYAPSLDQEAFYSDNPVLQRERSATGCFGVVAACVLVLVGVLVWGAETVS